MKNILLSEGTSVHPVFSASMTCVDEGFLSSTALMSSLTFKPSRDDISADEFDKLVEDIAERGLIHPVIVQVEEDGSVWIGEGRYRFLAAHKCGARVFAKVQYFGNAQRNHRILY